jgi:hypothetical protein
MADNVELDPGTGGAVVSTEEVTTLNGGAASAQHVQRMLLAFRTADGTAVDAPRGGGVEADALRVTVAHDSTGVLSVDDNGSSLTVDNAALSVTGGGVEATALRVTVASDSTGVLSVDDNGGSLTVDGTVTANLAAGTNNIGDVDVLTVPADPFGANADAAVAAGAAGSMQAKFRLMTSQLDSIKTAVETLDNAISGSEMQVDVLTLPALAAGTNNIGDVDVLTIAAGTNTIGDVGVKPRTSGGLTIFRSLDLDETEEEVKATAGQLFGWYIYNDGAADVSVKLYNATTANVTVGTTTPVMTLTIPAGAAANAFSEIGIAFGTAITAAAVTEIADNGTTAPAANQVVANFFYS